MKTTVNKVELIGYAGNTPELIEMSEKLRLVRFTMATRFRTGFSSWRTDWHQVIAWNEKAKFIFEKVKKGSRIQVIGRLQYRNIITRDGKHLKKAEILAADCQIMQPAK